MERGKRGEKKQSFRFSFSPFFEQQQQQQENKLKKINSS